MRPLARQTKSLSQPGYGSTEGQKDCPIVRDAWAVLVALGRLLDPS